MKKIYVLLLAMITFAVSTFAQVTVTGDGAGGSPYATLAAAITAVNGVGTLTQPTTITTSISETAPAGGYSITATGSAVNTLIISGGGNTYTAPTTHTVGALNDAIFKIIGADYVTIQNFVMLENAANLTTAAATNNMTEWGVALLYASTTNGAQNCIIQNNTITLNRTYQNTWGIYSNSTHSATVVTTSATATTAAGSNSGLKVYGNTISNVNQGILYLGPTAAADFNTGLDIGGTGGAQANTVTNWGTTGTFSGYANVSGTINCILVRNSNGYNVSYNTLTSSVGGNTVTTSERAIFVPAYSIAPTGTFTNTINNNNISVRSGLIAGTMNGIIVEATTASATSTLNINNNDFNNFGHTVAGTGAITFINTLATNQFTTINSNTFTNINVNTTGSVAFISQSFTAPATGTKAVNNNSIVTGFTKTGAGGTINLILDNGSTVSGAISNCQNNNFSNISVTGATTITGISYTDGGTAPTRTVTGNILNSWTGGTSAITAMNFTYWNGVSTLSNNTVTNITGQGIVTAINIGSTVSTATSVTINANVVNNLSSTGAGGAVTGIACANTSPGIVISNHTIHTLSSTGAAAVNAISITGANAAGTNVFKNKIYNISGSNASSTVNGIIISAGTLVNAYNNIIGDLRTPAANAANPLVGINVTGGTTVNLRFNTVWLNATSTGALFGSSAASISSTPTVEMRNNIFVNLSTANGAAFTAAYRRSTTTLTSYAAASNNNLFYAGTPGVNNLIFYDGTNSDQTLAAYKTRVSPRDGNAVTENPPFLSTAGASANFLHIDPTIATQVESGAGTIAGITDDFDGDLRNVTTPDIGADEGTFILADVTGPSITYTPLPFTCDGTVNRTLNTTITDASGVPTSGAGLPVLYWRINAGAWNAATATSGGGSAYSFSFGIGAVAADVVQYYIVAQDGAGTPNVGAFPSAGASGFTINPPAAATPPTTPSSYTIANTLSGIYTVGAGGNFTTLTAAVTAYNTSCLSGAVIFSLTDASYTTPAETFPLQINANPDASVVNTLTIRPAAGVASTISGSGVSIIKLNGADYVTIDGINSGGSSLSIINTNAAASTTVLWIATGSVTDAATNNTVRNCSITGATNITTTTGIIAGSGITFGNAAEVPNSNNTITGNTFKTSQNGVFVSGAVALDQNWNISNNNFGSAIAAEKHIFRGVFIGNAQNIAVNGNIINGVVSTTTSSSTMTGIQVGSVINGGTISKNKISDIKQTNTTGWGSNGIFLAATSTTSNLTVSNNFISDVASQGFNGITATDNGYGIMVNTGGGYNIYYNTVNLNTNQGAGAAAGITAAINIAAAVTTVGSINLRNNILSNQQTLGTRYGIYDASTAGATIFAAINYNDYSAQNVGFLTASQATLANWQAATGQDGASKAVVPVFVSATDFHLLNTNPSNNANLNANATPIGAITDDIDNEVRDVTTPDIGADEYIVAACSGSAGGTATLTNASVCSGSATTVTNTGYETIGTGLTYQWEFSIDNFVTDINDLTGQTNPATANTGNRTVTTYFRLRVICSTGPSTGYSNIVTLSINPKPTAGTTPSGTTSICAPATQLYTATTDIGDTYQWKLNGVNIGGANAATYTASASGSYQVVVTNSGTGCKDSSAAAILVVNAQPTSPTITPASATFCLGGSSVLVASGSTVPATILSENFNGVTAGTTTSGNLPAGWTGSSLTPGVRLWGVVANAQSGSTIGGGNFLYVESDLYTAFQTQSEVITPAFDASNYASVNIKFKQYYNDLSSGAATDSAKVYVSNNGGATWVLQQQYDADQGTAFTGAGAVSTTIALNAVPLTNNMKVKLYYASDVGGNDWYWAVDDFVIDGLQNVTYTWSPTAGLYTDAALTTAYTGTPLATVYASPAATQLYTVTATGPAPASCFNNTVTASITVTPPTSPNGLAAVAGGAQVCASTTVSATGTKFFDGGCDLVTKLTPNGGSPVSGVVNTCVKIDAAVGTYNGAPYLQRHFDIEPATAPATSTARVTLYVLQAEFDAYNLANGVYGDLPVAPGDASGIGNLLVTQYHGTSATSDPGTYSGTTELINPADVDIVWNATSNWWEISFDVTGFSGFFIHSGVGPLPISVNYLRGTKQGSVHNLNWKVTCTSSPTATMILERSGDNRTFTVINSVTADQLRCAQPFDYVDALPLAGINYYRLKIIDANGKVTYSNTIAMVNTKTGVTIVGIVPNPVTSNGNATLNVASAQKGTLRLVVTDVTGRQIAVQSEIIIAGSNQIAMNFAKLAAGSYNITAITDDGNKTSVRFIKQ